MGTALVDVPAAASRLGTSVRHVRRLVSDRKLEFVKVGHLVKFEPSALEAYIKKRTVPVVERR
jgi:excisionase family DNA binding protein